MKDTTMKDFLMADLFPLDIDPTYPRWICADCGDLYGHEEVGIACWHKGKCGVCREDKLVTEPRDYGHLKSVFRQHGKGKIQ